MTDDRRQERAHGRSRRRSRSNDFIRSLSSSPCQVRSGFSPVASGPSKETSAPKHTDHRAPQLRTYTKANIVLRGDSKRSRKRRSDRALTRARPEGCRGGVDATRREIGADRDARDVAQARWIRASLDRQIVSQVAALSCVPLEEDARAMLRAACGQQARSWMSAPIRARRVVS